MSQANKFIRLSAKSFLLSIGLTLVACGGGGGGGGGGDIPPAAVKYTGATSEASVTVATAEEIAKSYIDADQNNLGGIANSVIISSKQDALPTDAKNNLIEKLKQDAINAATNQNSIVTGAATALNYGNCANDAPLSLNLSNGTASSSILSQSSNEIITKTSYNNLCIYNYINLNGVVIEYYVIMNGDVYASVSGNLQTGIIDSIKLTIPGLSTKYVDLSVQPNQTLNITLSQNIIFLLGNYVDLVVNGEVFLDNNGNAIKVPTDITVIDYTDVESAGTIYRFETIDIIENNIFISSKDRFYHPTVGRIEYVDTLGYSGVCGNLPDSGTLIISTTSTQYTVTPVYATTNNPLDCGTYKVTGGAI